MDQNNQIISKNVMEDIVEARLDSLMKSMGACTCSVCRADVRAMALNKLPPCYVVSLSGEIFVNVNSVKMQSQTDIISAISNAIIKVKQFPRHEIAESTVSENK